MGNRSLAADIRITFDARAALRLVSRRGVGKTRHIDTQELWLQNAIRNMEVEVQTVAGEENVADMLTKNMKSEVLRKTYVRNGFHHGNKTRDGRRVGGGTRA